MKDSAEDRFFEKVKADDKTDCLLWTGPVSRLGYGLTWFRGKKHSVHRVAWMIRHGDIPEGRGHHATCVLHRCDVRNCVNPAHLFLGTHADNMGDMKRKHRTGNGNKTHCPSGHPYDAENTYRRKDGGRNCNECNRILARDYQRRRRAGRSGHPTTT